ncbi:MAG: hypothetical protein HY698_07030 [Deltaproteobacteria bacterium]|nr:hypothetical protein [Deltaproteobacteria bacterium]
MPRLRSPLVLLILFLTASPTSALEAKGTSPGEEATEIERALERLATARPGEERLQAAKVVLELSATRVDFLISRLQRPRTSSDQDRRLILARFGAEVPDEKGLFKQPPRPPKSGPPPEPDWLKEIAGMNDNSPALAESLESVVLIRALAGTSAVKAAHAILEFGFSPDGTAFRDECGRYLRNMSPYSLPALLRASGEKKRLGGSYARYASYQLDRLDKGRPTYVLAAAPDDMLEVAMLDAIRQVKHPDAVGAVLARTREPSHAVRKAAREAWLAYVTGPPPPPAPKAKRRLPGGRLTDEEMPLYLTYRELATEELRRVLAAVSETPPSKKATAEEMTRELFAIYDQQREALWDQTIQEAATLAESKDWAGACAKYDTILLNDPMYRRRAELVPAYLELGRLEAKQGNWEKAVVSFNKAFSLDPSGPHAKDAEAELHYGRGMLGRKSGQGVEDYLQLALKAKPDHSRARKALASAARSRHNWMLHAGLGSALGALMLAGWWFLRRGA